MLARLKSLLHDPPPAMAFEISETDAGTRLVSRNRIALPNAGVLQRLFYMFIMEPGSLIMERKMLLGIKERAEHTRPLPAPPTGAGADLDYRPHWPTRLKNSSIAAYRGMSSTLWGDRSGSRPSPVRHRPAGSTA